MSQAPEDQAFDAATEIVANSVMTVGLLPAYGRGVDDNVFAVGGMTADWNSKIKLTWHNINSDAMRPAKTKEVGTTTPNLPHVDGRYAKFGDHVDDFISGFEGYAKFLLHRSRDAKQAGLFDGFTGVPVRKVIRPTRFYYMLLQRLKNHRSMDDGAAWSAQADFIARLADWENDSDPVWPLQRAERSALVAMNVPHFVTPSDGHEIRDVTGFSIHAKANSGLDRARARVQNFNEQDIAWQIDGHPAEFEFDCEICRTAAEGRGTETTIALAGGRRAGKAAFHRGGRQDRRGVILSRHSPRARRRLDWS